MEKKTIGSFIAALRKASGLTQKQLADKLNVSDKSVSRWERDECAPDLSLIPVIADIFGVTTDELLRGQRNKPDSPLPENLRESSDKQCRHLLKSSRTSYQIRCILSLGLGFTGLLVAMLFNFGFLRASIGFLAGAVFYLAGMICQSIFMILGFSTVKDCEYNGDEVDDYRKYLLKTGQTVFSVLIVLLASTLPLLLIGDAYGGLLGSDWLSFGLLTGAIAAALCFFVCVCVNYFLGKAQKAPAAGKEQARRLLFLRCAALCCVVVLLTMVISGIVQGIPNQKLADSMTISGAEAFIEYMETPLSDAGVPMTPVSTRTELVDSVGQSGSLASSLDEVELVCFMDENGEYWEYEVFPEAILGEDGEVVEYLHLNQYVSYVDMDSSSEIPQFAIMTVDQMRIANQIKDRFAILFVGLAILEIACTAIIYRHKKKKL